MSEDKNQSSERLDEVQPDNPKPDPSDTPTWRAVKKGAKWGSVVGFIVANLIMSANSIDTPFGPVYRENVFGLFAIWIGLGTALGVGLGWASVQNIGSDDSWPPST